MFGIILSGRPPLVQPQPISETQFAFTIPSSPPFSHIVVFLIPGQTLPVDTAAGVYIQIPPAPSFKFLGAVGTGKESAIFKVNIGNQGFQKNTVLGGSNDVGVGDPDLMTDEPGATTTGSNGVLAPTNTGAPEGDITLGISIEPAANVAAQLAALPKSSISLQSKEPGNMLTKQQTAAPTTPAATKMLAQKIIGNAFNFLASFGSDTVPLKAFQEWWNKFEKRLDNDPGFLERDSD